MTTHADLSREAAVRVAAFEKALEHILFDGAAHAA